MPIDADPARTVRQLRLTGHVIQHYCRGNGELYDTYKKRLRNAMRKKA